VKNNTARAVILVAVFILAVVIIYPKFVEWQQQAVGSDGTGAAYKSNSPGGKALQAALESGKPTMVLFHSNTCGSCKTMLASVAEMKFKYAGRVNFIDVVVSDRAEARLVSEFGVSSIPTSVFFDKTGNLAGKAVGAIEKDKLIQILVDLE